MDCPCPLPAALTVIPAVECAVKIDQILKLAFQREGYEFTNEAAVQTLATWTGLKAATGDTKVIVTPSYIFNPVIPESEGQFEGGGDNTTPNGEPLYKGEGAVTFTAQVRGLTKAAYAAFKALSCESSPALSTGLVVYLLNRHGNIWMDTTNLTGLKISNFRISTPGNAGYNADNTYTISFTLPESWADGLAQVVPTDFKGHKDL